MLERLPLAEEACGEGSGTSPEVGQSMLPEPDRASDVATQRRQSVFEQRTDALERRRIGRNGIRGDQVTKRPQLHRREVHGLERRASHRHGCPRAETSRGQTIDQSDAPPQGIDSGREDAHG